jgi:hypothetical protein
MPPCDIVFGTADGSAIEPDVQPGRPGAGHSYTQRLGTIRVRMADHTPGYPADHWCSKGHILFCVDGALRTGLAGGRMFTPTPGMACQMVDNAGPHRSGIRRGARLFVAD